MTVPKLEALDKDLENSLKRLKRFKSKNSDALKAIDSRPRPTLEPIQREPQYQTAPSQPSSSQSPLLDIPKGKVIPGLESNPYIPDAEDMKDQEALAVQQRPNTLEAKFARIYGTYQSYTIHAARLVAWNGAPPGVNPEDPAVKAVVARCRSFYGTSEAEWKEKGSPMPPPNPEIANPEVQEQEQASYRGPPNGKELSDTDRYMRLPPPVPMKFDQRGNLIVSKPRSKNMPIPKGR